MDINVILKKQVNEPLNYAEIQFVVNSFINGTINEEIMKTFLQTIYDYGMTIDEIYALTDVMVKSGKILDFSSLNKTLVDKHSTGGVGDKTTLVLLPIVSSLGLTIPKMSGRSLGLTGGTIDKLESIYGYKVNLDNETLMAQLKKIDMAVVAQSDDVAKADKMIYALRDKTKLVDSIPLIVSSILSKKIASGANNIVIDLKVGSGAFMKDIEEATILANTMIEVGKKFNKKIVCVLTNMTYPVGKSIGNVLEVKEAIEFFNGIYDKRFCELVVYLASTMVKIGKNISFEEANKQVLEVIANTSAKSRFYEWIEAQGGSLNSLKDYAKKMVIKTERDGFINNIDSKILAQLCSDLGASRKNGSDVIDYAVGIKLEKTVGEKVSRGDILCTIFFNKSVPKISEICRSAFLIEDTQKQLEKQILKVIE
jgi:pyrimidine-nucleoside phosphorylase